jgi:hypothetical protein
MQKESFHFSDRPEDKTRYVVISEQAISRKAAELCWDNWIQLNGRKISETPIEIDIHYAKWKIGAPQPGTKNFMG